MDNAETGLRATRVRWHIVALLAFMAGLTYVDCLVDRLNLGIAGTYIQGEFRLSNQSMGGPCSRPSRPWFLNCRCHKKI